MNFAGLKLNLESILYEEKKAVVYFFLRIYYSHPL